MTTTEQTLKKIFEHHGVSLIDVEVYEILKDLKAYITYQDEVMSVFNSKYPDDRPEVKFPEQLNYLLK